MIRTFTEADFPGVYDIVHGTQVLDIHKPYTYWMLLHHSPDFCLVFEDQGNIIGFTVGLQRYADDDTVFMLQIGVDPNHHRQGIGTSLASEFLQRAVDRNYRRVVLTITPDNTASKQLFTSIADQFGSSLETSGDTGTLFDNMKKEIIYIIQLAE